MGVVLSYVKLLQRSGQHNMCQSCPVGQGSGLASHEGRVKGVPEEGTQCSNGGDEKTGIQWESSYRQRQERVPLQLVPTYIQCWTVKLDKFGNGFHIGFWKKK